MPPRKKKSDKLDFEKSLKQLEKIVKRLEDEQVPLEESIALFEEGRKLAAACERELASAENRVRMLTESADEDDSTDLDDEEDGDDEMEESAEDGEAENDEDAPALAPGEEEFPF